MNIGIYPGSFDPITVGHIDIIEKALQVCDELHIVVAVNYDKKHMFSIEDRTEMVIESIRTITIPTGKTLKVVKYSGVISDYSKKISSNLMIRGIRSHIDLAYEQNIEQFTKKTSGATTLYFTAEPEHMFTSSSLVRQFISTNNLDKIEDMVSEPLNVIIKSHILGNPTNYLKNFNSSEEILYSN